LELPKRCGSPWVLSQRNAQLSLNLKLLEAEALVELNQKKLLLRKIAGVEGLMMLLPKNRLLRNLLPKSHRHVADVVRLLPKSRLLKNLLPKNLRHVADVVRLLLTMSLTMAVTMAGKALAAQQMMFAAELGSV